MLFRSLRASGTLRSAARNIHTSSPRLDTATSAKKAAEGAKDAAGGVGKQISNLAARAQTLGKPLADRASSMTGVNVSSLTETVQYQLRVAGSLFKQVYIAEGLAPPKTFKTFSDAYKTMYERTIDPNFWTKLYNSGDWKKFAIYSLEVYGIFTIGEMIGRRHLVGYKIKKSAHPSHEEHH
ncbi:hypothetical protein CBS101457_003341 [Exobasidium rhododendri]|nr:hypothetical protein CBS101457_003341 [Exobasidium rhododendri]